MYPETKICNSCSFFEQIRNISAIFTETESFPCSQLKNCSRRELTWKFAVFCDKTSKTLLNSSQLAPLSMYLSKKCSHFSKKTRFSAGFSQSLCRKVLKTNSGALQSRFSAGFVAIKSAISWVCAEICSFCTHFSKKSRNSAANPCFVRSFTAKLHKFSSFFARFQEIMSSSCRKLRNLAIFQQIPEIFLFYAKILDFLQWVCQNLAILRTYWEKVRFLRLFPRKTAQNRDFCAFQQGFKRVFLVFFDLIPVKPCTNFRKVAVFLRFEQFVASFPRFLCVFLKKPVFLRNFAA